METVDVYGLVPEDRADHLQQALTLAGIDDGEVEARPAPPGWYQLHDETLHQDAVGARRGLVVGAVVGAIVGLALALVLPAIAGAGATATTIAAVAGFGGLVGAMAGLLRADSLDSDPVAYCEVGSEDPVTLVGVHDEHWRHRAHRLMEHHDAVFLQEPDPVEPVDVPAEVTLPWAPHQPAS